MKSLSLSGFAGLVFLFCVAPVSVQTSREGVSISASSAAAAELEIEHRVYRRSSRRARVLYASRLYGLYCDGPYTGGGYMGGTYYGGPFIDLRCFPAENSR